MLHAPSRGDDAGGPSQLLGATLAPKRALDELGVELNRGERIAKLVRYQPQYGMGSIWLATRAAHGLIVADNPGDGQSSRTSSKGPRARDSA